jgi:ketosteroid isomerase-like protein
MAYSSGRLTRLNAGRPTSSAKEHAKMTHETMMSFATEWVANWNRRDVEAVLGHFADDAEFVSPLATKYAGQPTLSGKAAIGAYWRAALGRIETLEFKLDHASWDESLRELTVICAANLNGNRQRAVEIMRFRADGMQVRGEAFYGAGL